MEMQNAQDVYIQTIEGLLEDSEIEKAIDKLLDLDQKTQAGLRQDVIQLSGNFKEAQRSFQRNLISFEEYGRTVSRTRYALLDLMKDLPKRVQLNARVRSVSTFQFELPDEAHLEKIIGPTSNLLRINWLEKALQAAKAVCRVVCADGSKGTGFLTRDGYIFTNQHVIPSAEVARTARVEFNYELDPPGNVRSRTAYDLDITDFSTDQSLDFTRARVVDRNDAPLSQWGYVDFDTEALPVAGESVTIIQHPNGEDKQIALNANEVISIWDQYLFYTTDTEPGSSGSPVFNRDWRVVAIHHAGKTENGGIQINARGDRKKANRGILVRDIFKHLGLPNERRPADIPAERPEPGQREILNPQPPQPVEPKVMQPLSSIPKFVIVNDLADSAQCLLLNKHLNVLKFTKKIRVYNVQDGTGDLLANAETELADADYLLVLVTVNIFNSPQWFELVSKALEQGRRVIPILIEKADYDGTGLEKLRSLPSQGRSVSDFPNVDTAYNDIATELRKLLPK